ncbi:hypothetical protein DQ04_14961020, partial [Trypanosoma grayi]|uniref:hypothetical protein n=1 Tax=Trypanosoma grayi TaxID=71804 RepID=UPI0004F403F9
WLRAAGVERLLDLDRWSQAGPVLWGLRFSPRLLLNYLVANAVTYPLYSLQLSFCVVAVNMLRCVLLPLRNVLRARQRSSRGSRVPKAPSSAATTPTPAAAAAAARPGGRLTR